MSLELSKQTRLIVISVVLIAAVLMIAVLPFTVPSTLNQIQVNQQERVDKFYAEGNPQAPLIETTMELVGWAFPLWMSLTIMAGIILLFIAKPFYNGERWARGLTLLCLSIPAISGAYMLVPYLNFVNVGFPPALYYMIVGLIAYFTVLLAERSDVKQKLLNFWVFLMLGVTAAESWANGHAAHRILDGHPKMPFYAEGIFILAPARNISWIALLFLLAAIYFLAMRTSVGWYLALFGAATTGLIGFATQYVRTATYDYLYQGLMGLAIVITLLIPAVKSRLIDDETDKTKLIQGES